MDKELRNAFINKRIIYLKDKIAKYQALMRSNHWSLSKDSWILWNQYDVLLAENEHYRELIRLFKKELSILEDSQQQ